MPCNLSEGIRSEAKKRALKKGYSEEFAEEYAKGYAEGYSEGRKEERVRTIGVLLTIHSPDVLLNDPQFSPLGYAQAEIDAALALGGAQTPIVPAQ